MNRAHPSHVYVVEDSPSVRSRITQMIGRLEGVRVVGESDTVPRAIVDILSLNPDAVLLDLDLKGDSGLRVLRAIHARSPSIAFVVLTNHCEAQYRRAAREAGAAYFLDKSSEFERIPGVLAEIAATQH